MKQTFLPLLLAIAAAGVSDAGAANVRYTSPVDYNVSGISANGLWAVGLQGNSMSDVYSFRWNLITNEFEVSDIESGCGGSIANDGTYCGGFKYTDPDGRTFVAPGYYDGEWHVLPMPEGKVTDAIDGSISPDGRHMAISVEVDGLLKVVQYEDKKLVRIMHTDNDHARVYCITDDGSRLGGWTYAHIPGVSINRTGVYWEGDKDYILIDGDKDPTKAHRSPWAGVKSFSPDGKYALYYGGWVPKIGDDPAHITGIKNLETGEVMPFYHPVDDQDLDFMVGDMTEDLTCIGSYGGQAIILFDGKAQYMLDWLKEEKGIDARAEWTDVMEYNGEFLLGSPSCIQRNGNAIGFIYNGTDQELHSMIIKFDVELGHVAPAVVRASQMEKTTAARVSWVMPYGIDESEIKGYNLYRDGVKVNSAPLTGTYYYDEGLEAGTAYTWNVTAIYEEGESEKSDAAQLTVSAIEPEAPVALASRQRGVNSVSLNWDAPLTNKIAKRYYDVESLTEGFGTSSAGISMEVGTRFDADELALYKDAKITGVDFYPMSKQSDWNVTLYTLADDGTVEPIATYPVTQELRIGERNVFNFPEPIAIPAGKNLLAAVGVTVVNENECINVYGIQHGKTKQGYSDLLRRTNVEPAEDFGSLYTQSQAMGTTLAMNWKVSLILTPDGMTDEIDKVKEYVVSVNGQETGRSETCSYVDTYLADGNYEYGVKAVYSDGRVSPVVTASLNVKANEEAGAGVGKPAVNINGDEVNVTWEAPEDYDKTFMTWATGNRDMSTHITAGNNNFNLQAASIYPATKLRGYDGYRIVGARFYPTCDATYTIIIDKGVGTRELVYHEIDSFEQDQWNEVIFDEPVELEANTSYRLIVDCYDVEDNGSPLAVDDNDGQSGVTDLINVKTGSDVWQDVGTQTGRARNWMMGLVITDREGIPMPVSGYDVIMDGKKQNTERLTQTEASFSKSDLNLTDTPSHRVSINTWYEPFIRFFRGEEVEFTLEAGAVDESFVADIRVCDEGARIRVTGGVERIEIYDLDGAKVADVQGETVDVSDLCAGVYVLKAHTSDSQTVTKINIRK